MDDEILVRSTRNWIEQLVIAFDLCPFASRVVTDYRIRFAVSHAPSIESLLADLLQELHWMKNDPQVETSLLIHPDVLADFADYNDFLDLADALLEDSGYEGIFQIASFHPQYQFAGTAPDDVENYTNRSPYPMLHILREDSLARAIDSYEGVDQIPDRNIATLKELGPTRAVAILRSCMHPLDNS